MVSLNYLLSIGLILLGILALFVTIFKYSKEQQKKLKFTGSGTDDEKNKRMALLTAEDDEIHIALEVDENNHLVMHPRWNINIIILGEKHLKFTTNSLGETLKILLTRDNKKTVSGTSQFFGWCLFSFYKVNFKTCFIVCISMWEY